MILSGILGVSVFVLFLFFQAHGIYGGDSGDMVTASVIGGVPHPPGYPLYTALGWILTRLPFSTPAFAVGLLSSVPHALAVFLVYLTTYRLTKRVLPSLLSALVLAGNYLFFLYSVTPEVFGMFDFFVALELYLFVRWYQTKNSSFAYIISFVFGLSLSHHHVMLFLVPAGAFLASNIYSVTRSSSARTVTLCVLFALVGLLPYLYVPFAASHDPIISYDRVTDGASFIRLVTRADYGTFASSGSIGETMVERLLAIRAYANFVFVDFTAIGLLLMGFGLRWLFLRHRSLGIMWVVALMSLGPIFFFYASFPLANGFMLATYERFLLPSYLFFSILIGLGSWHIAESVYVRSLRHLSKKKAAIVPTLIGCTLLMFPLLIGGMTLWRFSGISEDRTADYLGRDLLASAPQGAIVLMANDTSLFVSQYMRYAKGFRDDVILLHASRLQLPEYQQVVAKNYPSLDMPQETGAKFYPAFVTTNYQKRPIYSNGPLAIGADWYWVPHGLLFEAVRKDDLPKASAMYQENAALWKLFADPTRGIIHRYRHLMLSDVLDVYANSRIEFGMTLMRANMWDEAKYELLEAVRLQGDSTQSRAYMQLGLVYLEEKSCQDALESFASSRKSSYAPNPLLYLYESVTYRDCLKDEGRAKELYSAYERVLQRNELPLDQL